MCILRIILAFSVLSTLACTRLTNKADSMKIDCGQVLADREYIKILQANGTPFEPRDLEVLNADQAFSLLDDPTVLTDKACLLRKPGAKYFVRNKAKTLGRLFDFQDPAKTSVLEPLKDSLPQVELGCDSTVYSDGKRLTLSLIGLKEPQVNPYLMISLSLSREDEALYQWPEQVLAQHMEFELEKVKLSPQSEYLLKAEIRDNRLDRGSLVRCKLRVDPSEVQIVLGDRARTIVPYFGRNFYTVDSGYAVDFYVQTGFKDLEIEYCVKAMDFKDLDAGRWPVEDCEKPRSFVKDEAVVLKEGFWMIRYRGIRGHLQGDWQTNFVLVDKVCYGELEPQNILDMGCTKLEGSVAISWSTPPLDQTLRLHTITGSLQIDPDFNTTLWKNLKGFERLVSIGGDLSFTRLGYASPVLNLEGLDRLEWIGGSLRIEESNFGFLSIGPLPQLKRIGSSLRLYSAGVSSVNDMPNLSRLGSIILIESTIYRPLDLPSLKQIDGDIRLQNSIIELEKLPLEKIGGLNFNTLYCDLDFLGSVTSIREVTLSECNLENLKGLEHVQTISKALSLNNLQSLKSLDGLAATKVGDVILTDLRSLRDVKALGFIQEAGRLQLGSGVQSIEEPITELPDLHCESFQGIVLVNLQHLADLSALRTCGHLQELVLAGLSSVTDFNVLKQLESVEYLLLMDLPLSELPDWPLLKHVNALNLGLAVESLRPVRQWNIESLAIYGGRLANLDGLQEITRLETLKINSSSLTDLRGLENLKTVQYLETSNNVKLQNLQLDSLQHAGTIEIYDGTLRTLSMDSLQQVDESVTFENLTELNKLSLASFQTGTLKFINVPVLERIEGLC